jgi:aryl-alcohol dehydrogenase-like predicted oxidoreductase
LRHAVEGSLRRLKVERIDLYQLHAPDPKVPLVDSFGALADLRSEGKIRHLGISNINVEQLDVARSIAPVVTVQNAFNLRNRDSQNVLEACEKLGIAFLPWFPLGGKRGMRAGKVRSLAEKNGLSVQELSIAWLLSRSSAMLPIPGTNSLEHLVKNMRASSVRLSQDDLNALH